MIALINRSVLFYFFPARKYKKDNGKNKKVVRGAKGSDQFYFTNAVGFRDAVYYPSLHKIQFILLKFLS